LKKIIITLMALFFLIFFPVGNLFAFPSIYIDGDVAAVEIGNDNFQIGGGVNLGINVYKNVNVFYKGEFTSSLNSNVGGYDLNNNFLDNKPFFEQLHFVGAEYVFPFYRFAWKSSVMVGVGMINQKKKIENYDYEHASEKSMDGIWIVVPSGSDGDGYHKIEDAGLALGFWTGVIFYVNQNFGVYLDVGYVYTAYAGVFLNSYVHDFQTVIGMRFTIGSTKDYAEDYE